MHELSIAKNIVDVVLDQLEIERSLDDASDAPRVLRVKVRVGMLSGVVPEALLFAFDSATSGTPVSGATLEVERVPVTVWCERCQAERTLPDPTPLRCPHCGERTPQTLQGKELEVAAIELLNP